MKVQQTHTTQSAAQLPQTTKAAAPGSSASSFAELLRGVAPKASTVSAILSPIKTGGVGTGGSSSPSDTTPSPAPFTATYQTGATITAPDGTKAALNPLEMATIPTAQEVASLLGGSVTEDSVAGGFVSSSPTLEISVPGSANLINAGAAANLFAEYGTAQGSQAWQIIDRDLGLSS